MMQTRYLSAAGALAVIFVVQAHTSPVNRAIVRQVAANWYAERGQFQQEAVRVASEVPIGRYDAGLLCAFNMEPPGFVLVAADDAVVPVLGYGFVHHISQANLPPPFDAMVAGFEEQILFAQQHNLPASNAIYREWQRLSAVTDQFDPQVPTREVTPLMVSIWEQVWPWNQCCPPDPNGTGGHAKLGCGAVAMGQLMRYWNHPAQGQGEHSYDHPDYGTQSADFGATTYEWAEMSDSVATYAAALLLYHCGVAIEMDYGPNGSGCDDQDLLPALAAYFRYNLEAVYLRSEDYSDTTWEAMVRDELDAGRPLIYSGIGTGGHLFNVDGYQGTSYFHVNWGWAGLYNGYYYLNDLTPGNSNYTRWQRGSFNLFPDNSLDPIPPGAVTDLVTSQIGSDLLLAWSPATDNTGVVGYWVLRSTSPFGPLTPEQWVVNREPLTYVASGACGDANINTTFAVCAMDAAQNQGPPSNRAGEFDYELQQ